MPPKRTRSRSSSPSAVSAPLGQRAFWRQLLALLALVPLAVGVFLILTAVTGLLIWNTVWQQILIGIEYVLLSFLLSNALQAQWTLAAGWFLLGAALWLGTHAPVLALRPVAALLAGAGGMLVARVFLRRRRQYLEDKRR